MSDLPPEYVIKRIQELRRDWTEVEIEYARFEKRWAFDPPNSPAQYTGRGRFVITADDWGQLESWSVDSQGRKVPGDTFSRLIWTPEELHIHEGNRIEDRISRQELREVQQRIREGLPPTPDNGAIAEEAASDQDDTGQEPLSLGHQFLACLFSVFDFRLFQVNLVEVLPESPKACLPLVFADDMEKLAERFDLVVMENKQYFYLRAYPRHSDDKMNCREIAICLNRETFVPIARRIVLPAGDDYVSFAVTSLRANGNEISLTAGSVPAKTP